MGKGCPQGGVLSPTLWCLVVDSLIRKLNDAGIFTQAFADDVVLMVRGEDEDTLTGVMQFALGLVEEWCKAVRLTRGDQALRNTDSNQTFFGGLYHQKNKFCKISRSHGLF